MARRATPHFTPELFRFLRQLKRNNDREWFEKNRERYLEHVRDPMLQFIEDFEPRLAKITPQLVADARPQGGSMFRIHRDVRFAKDKSPYKTVASAQFRHVRGKDAHAPSFYLHLGADEVFVGMGLWHPDGAALTKIREVIADDPKRWQALVRGRAFTSRFRLVGESLKRPPRGFDPNHPLVEDLKRKDFIAAADLDEQAACAPGFLTDYTKLCRAAAPFTQFLTESVGLRW